jgi:hypothetical protein
VPSDAPLPRKPLKEIFPEVQVIIQELGPPKVALVATNFANVAMLEVWIEQGHADCVNETIELVTDRLRGNWISVNDAEQDQNGQPGN